MFGSRVSTSTEGELKGFTFSAIIDVIHDHLVIVTSCKSNLQQFSRVNILLTEELAVTSSAVHQVSRQITRQLGAGLGD